MKRRNTLLFFLFVMIGLAVLLSPFWLWQFKGTKELNVLIMDKTVPDKTYREHNGLVYILNNQKYVKANKDKYFSQSDYKGFKPSGDNSYKISELPDDLSDYDVLYLTDQYGVYEEEFYGSNNLGERSDKLYGGLEIEDVEKIENALFQSDNKTLIAEFNTFASPTSDEAREKITNLLNVSWSGWMGRHFDDLDGDEVPVWVKDNYKNQNGKEWSFTGSGLVLINKDDYIVVLNNKDLTDSGVAFSTTEKGQSVLKEELTSTYDYWFDIIAAKDQKEVLAQYKLPVSESGKEKLEGYGIPSTFPAIVQNANTQYTSYYFAGDYADEAEVPSLYQTVGFDLWKKYVTYRNSFYWNTYVPLMKNLLKDGLHNNNTEGSTIETVKADGMVTNSRTNAEYIQVQKDGKWENLIIKGVNMGISKPGSFPGETSITKDEYYRWFKEIGAMHANTIRVYTLHPPGFYQALYEYNQSAKEPLYLIHGSWVNEDVLTEKQDAYSEEVVADAQLEIKNMIDIIHGNADLPKRAGHASGKYEYDVSKYVLGFMLGTEWDPDVVNHTDEEHSGLGQYKGTYFETKAASPFEIWVAKLMDYAADYEAKQYKWQHTMSFTNWVTTDLLDHPAEPSEDEDKAVVDPNHITKTDDFHAGLFAAYHVYPYYPDFLNYEKGYLTYKNKQGEQSNYAAYLNQLRKVHNMPVLVAEFGVPASRGKTHENVNGMNQGFISEEEQGNMDASLYQMILDEKYAGGLVFTWQDEWFKRTWNTMDYDNPNRRPFWSNIQTNEQHFGLLSFDPGKYEPTIYIDGSTEDWEKLNVSPLYTTANADNKEENDIQDVSVTSDEQQISFKFTYKEPVDLNVDHTYLLLDTLADQGQMSTVLDGKEKVNTDFGVDFAVKIGEQNDSHILIDSYYDSYYFHYGHLLNMIKKESYASKKNNGVYHPIRLALNKELEIQGEKIPFNSYETGKLLYGNGNPESKDFNSLADISVSKDKKTIELRLPWALLNVKDPSQKEVLADLWKKGMEGSETIDGIYFAVVMEKDKKIVQTLPERGSDNTIHQEDTKLFEWESWEEPAYHERLKQSYYILQEAFSKIGN
ncbi:hypothetical protein [Niallia sp. MER 6]|uniref:hypothetical protein n=1 Tax=Niallia sp. MER 6 TaxID=2939567 RepID=UPI00203C0675|nr:hypothetical protein [Niallia sp. MER 6]MCM3030273.1 hypothetical protein [Niallia sp. MER 6]